MVVLLGGGGVASLLKGEYSFEMPSMNNIYSIHLIVVDFNDFTVVQRLL